MVSPSFFRSCLAGFRFACGIFLVAGAAGCRQNAGPPAVPTSPSPAESAAALESLSEKAPVRIAWLEGEQLLYFDSVQPAAPRVLRTSPSQERPVFTPDGAAVLVTDASKIIAVTLPAGEPQALADGHAFATGREPESKTDWVYATESADGRNVFRFPLHEPARREIVWDGAPLDPRTAQASRNGRQLAGSFHGVDGGTADVTDRVWTKISAGRPLALAPDLTYLTAMLDGTGRRLRFFHPSGEPWARESDDLTPPARWQAEIPEAVWAGPETRFTGLRWSHHPRFLVLSAAGNAGPARLALARLSPTADRVEALAVLSAAGADVRGIDAWVGGAATASLAEWPASPPTYRPPAEDGNGAPLLWPRGPDGASFLWDTRHAINQIPGRAEPCRIVPKGTARFGEWGDMVLDGGFFEADAASAQAVAAAAVKTNQIVLQLLVTEFTDVDGSLSTRLAALQLTGNRDAFSLSRVDQALVFRALLDAGDGTPPREHQSLISPLAITPGRPFHLLLELRNGVVTWTIDGEQIGHQQELGPGSLAGWRPQDVTRLVFGDEGMRNTTGWRARMEKILFVNRTVAFRELRDNRANAAAATPRRPGSVIRVRATLLETTPVPPTTSGGALLVQQQYDVHEVLSGQLKANPLSVWHWARLDGLPVPSLPTQTGSTYDLRISTLLRHQETELEETLLGAAGLPSPGYLDVAPPQDPPTIHAATSPTVDDVDR